MAERICAVDGCGGKHYAKDYCHRHYSQAWYAANTERAKLTQAVYRETRRDEARGRAQEWRTANPERVREGNRRWYAANTDIVREYKRKYRATNRDKIRALNNRRKATQRGVAINDLTADEWVAIKAAYGNRCAYCQKRRKLTMDHVVPLSKGGHHTAANVIPACGPCNSHKGDRDAPTFQPLLM